MEDTGWGKGQNPAAGNDRVIGGAAEWRARITANLNNITY